MSDSLYPLLCTVEINSFPPCAALLPGVWNLKSIFQHHNKQQIVVNVAFSEVPQWVLHSHSANVSQLHIPWQEMTAFSIWCQHRGGGVGFPECRGSTWVCAGGSTAVGWPPAFQLRGLCQAKLLSKPLLEDPHPPPPHPFKLTFSSPVS